MDDLSIYNGLARMSALQDRGIAGENFSRLLGQATAPPVPQAQWQAFTSGGGVGSGVSSGGNYSGAIAAGGAVSGGGNAATTNIYDPAAYQTPKGFTPTAASNEAAARARGGYDPFSGKTYPTVAGGNSFSGSAPPQTDTSVSDAYFARIGQAGQAPSSAGLSATSQTMLAQAQQQQSQFQRDPWGPQFFSGRR